MVADPALTPKSANQSLPARPQPLRDPYLVPQSASQNIIFPAYPKKDASNFMAMLWQLERTQWWPRDVLMTNQRRQLARLLGHAYQNVPGYKDKIEAAGLGPGNPLTEQAWLRMPVLTRKELQDNRDAYLAQTVPKVFGKQGGIRTSGSTGRPVRVNKSAFDQFLFQCMMLRGLFWNNADPSGNLAKITIEVDGPGGAKTEPSIAANWGPGMEIMVRSGKVATLDVRNPLERQWAFLAKFQPVFLSTYPSNAEGLAKLALERGERLPSLRQVWTLGETLSPVQRETIESGLGAQVIDAYSSQEIGYMGLQAPGHTHYLVPAETVRVEILNDDDMPCAPGEQGRVVVTSLHNFVQPLIRYEIGDLAVPGDACPTGRGLPVIERVLGRSRSLAVAPDGSRFWPGLGDNRFDDVAPIKQAQLVQTSRTTLLMRFVPGRPITAEEEDKFREIIRTRMGHPYEISFEYLDEIPRAPSGKYEDFVALKE